MKYVTTLFLISFCFWSLAQNIVPNPSFEDTTACPAAVAQLYRAQYWMSFRNSPEYFHGCDNNINGIVGVPSNFICYQEAHSGVAYAGFIPYDLTGAPYREYLAIKLSEATQVNQEYDVSFYVSFAAAIGFTIAVNKLGIALTNELYSEANPYPITNNPIAYEDSIYTDSIGWSQVSLSFVADSVYQYLIIGNFFDDEQTDTLNVGEFNTHSYYLIDDVCLRKNGQECLITDGLNLEVQGNSAFNVFPNPASSGFQIQCELAHPVRIYNGYGKLIYLDPSPSTQLVIDCSNWKTGIYFIQYNNEIQGIVVTH